VLWPREHGAWGLLSAPLLLGTIVGLRLDGHRWGGWAALLVAAFSLFLLRTPLEARLGRGVMRVASVTERRATEARILFFGLCSAVACGFVLTLLPLLPVLLAGGIAAAAYGAGWLPFISRRNAQALAAVAMATGAPLACIALADASAQTTLLVFAAAAVMASDQVSYVHLQVSALHLGDDTRATRWRSGWQFFLFQSLIAIALIAAWRGELLTPIAVAAFVPLLARGCWHFLRGGRRLSFRRLGFSELGYTAMAVAGVAAGIRVWCASPAEVGRVTAGSETGP